MDPNLSFDGQMDCHVIVLGAQLKGSVISCLFYIPNRKGLYEEILDIISRRNFVSRKERGNLQQSILYFLHALVQR